MGIAHQLGTGLPCLSRQGRRLIDVLLGGQASPETRRTLETHLSDPQVLQASLDDPIRAIDHGVVAGLVLGAPEFQRR